MGDWEKHVCVRLSVRVRTDFKKDDPMFVQQSKSISKNRYFFFFAFDF